MRHVSETVYLALVGILLAALVGCGKPHETSAYPQVVEIRYADGGLCSGTIISTRAVLTAEHCVKGRESFSVRTSRGDFRTENFRAMEQSRPGVHDLAVLLFDEEIAATSDIMPIGHSVQEGDTIEIVGFGCNELRTAGGAFEQRSGRNTIREVHDLLEVSTPIEAVAGRNVRTVIGQADSAGACPGDSGGPAAKREGAALTLVGVTYAIAVRDAEVVSYFVDLTRHDNVRFLSDINRHHSLQMVGI